MDSTSVSEFIARFPALKPLEEIFYRERRGDFLIGMYDDLKHVPSIIDYYCDRNNIDPKEFKGPGVYGPMKDHRYKVLVAVLLIYQPRKLEVLDARLNEDLAENLKSYFQITSGILSKNIRISGGLYRISRKHKTRYNEEVKEFLNNFLQRPH